jgi:hypothetical protein
MAQTTRTFRIFVSSTFSDLKGERNALQRFVFPRLRGLCVDHGCRFQAIDLRWGVREEAGLDQQTMRICLDEVNRSQRSSPRPNFIVLLGDRYGWRPLPAEIPASEFERIEKRIETQGDRVLLNRWYRRDDNARLRRRKDEPREPVYCLLPRELGSRFVDFAVWEAEVERPVRQILLKATRAVDLSDEERLKYEASATEQEIAAGALGVPDADEHVFCFFRTLTNHPDAKGAAEFVDLNEDGLIDDEAGLKLRDLKDRLEARLPGNVHHYAASWTGDGISTDHIGELPNTLGACIDLLEEGTDNESLCVDVWKRLAPIILDEITRLERVEPLEKEIADHQAFGEDRARLFVGRASLLQFIASHVQGSDPHPLALVGEPGSGKSALVAKSIADCVPQMPHGRIMCRFIGATPESSDVRTVLESVCREISRVYGVDETSVPTDFDELVKDFPERLSLASEARPLVLFLDALDQLSDANRARDLVWLPSELPKHVHIIVSALPGPCHSALRRKLPSANIVGLEPMPGEEGRELLQLWLNDSGRTLQHSQSEQLLGRFESCGMPLYLKLAFEEARRWTSYAREVDLAPDVAGIIRQLFGRLSADANHGATMVSRSLGYLAAARNGLSEDELLDVLSRDEEVMTDFESRARHTAPERRLPVIVWSRLFFDLEPYLTERSADGATLLGFYHRQLYEVAEAEFLAGADRAARHAHLADYFASQDLFERERQTPNLRKLSELPFQQTRGERWDDLYATLTDFDFLEAKCTHVAVVTTGTGDKARTVYGGVYELQEDYRRALEELPDAGGSGMRSHSGRRPIIVTAADLGMGLMVRCPFCNQSHAVREDWLGKEIECLTNDCQGLLRLNPFVVRRPN